MPPFFLIKPLSVAEEKSENGCMSAKSRSVFSAEAQLFGACRRKRQNKVWTALVSVFPTILSAVLRNKGCINIGKITGGIKGNACFSGGAGSTY